MDNFYALILDLADDLTTRDPREITTAATSDLPDAYRKTHRAGAPAALIPRRPCIKNGGNPPKPWRRRAKFHVKQPAKEENPRKGNK